MLLLLGMPLLSVPQFSIKNNKVNKEVTTAFEALYDFQFETAHDLISRNIENGNANAWHYFTISNIQLWEIFAGASGDNIKKNYRENLNQQFQFCDELSHEKEERFLRIMYYAYLSRLTMQESEYLTAFRTISNYYDLVKPTFEDTSYAPYMLIDGLYYYLFDYARKEYVLLRPFLEFYEEGDAGRGLRYLKKAANSSNKIIRTEACYFLIKIWFDLEDKPKKAFPYARRLHHTYPGNFIFDLYYRKIKKSLDPDYSPDLEKIKERVLTNSELNTQQKTYFQYLLKHRYPA